MAKLDPALRWLLRRQAQAVEGRSPSLDLARYAQVLGVYTERGALVPALERSGELEGFSSGRRRRGPKTAASAARVGVLIQIQTETETQGPVLAGLEGLGIVPLSRVGGVITAHVTLEQLRQMINLPGVIYVEAGYRLRPELDRSVPAVRADVLHTQEPIALGGGVLLGDVDTGVDYGHLDFRVDRDGDGTEEGSRIAFIWDQTEERGFGDRSAVPYGTQYTRADIETDLANGYGYDFGLVRERDEDGHGTHVLGIAGGDGSASSAGYVGMAPQATLAVVKTTFSSGDIVDGVRYLFEKADSLGLPAVVNLSLGGHFGPHDGTGAFERALNELASGPGRIIVNSAGNEGNDRIHVGGTLNDSGAGTGTGTGASTSMSTSTGTEATFDFRADAEVAVLNFWYPGSSSFTVEVSPPPSFGPEGTQTQTLIAPRGTYLQQETPAGVVTIDNASGGPYPGNGDNQAFVILEGIAEDSRWTVTLRDEGGGGRYDGWVGLSYMGEFLHGDSRRTISEPGNAPRLITVGAYTSKDRWMSILGSRFRFRGGAPVGEIAPFSSHGPTRDGRQKPDLSAPGTAIVSSLAEGSDLGTVLPLVDPDGVHAVLQGTSMAAPHVAGAVALMLQAEPTLDARQVLARLRATASGDPFTGSLPNLTWGYGKLDSLTGLDTIGLGTPAAAGEPPTLKLGANPASERVFFFYTLPAGTRSAELVVFDVLGRPLYRAGLDPEANRYEWDLRDGAGRRLANGLYLCLVVADRRASTTKTLVIRRGS